MKEFLAMVSAVLVIVIYGVGLIRYVFQVIRNPEAKAFMLSTWLLFSVATGLNVFSFFWGGDREWYSGILGICDFALCIIVFLITLKFAYGGFHLKPFECYYLIGAAAIVLFWILSDSSLVTNLLAEGLLVVAYIPTIHNILVERKSSEPVSTWYILLLGTVFSFHPAIAEGEWLSVIYSFRAFVSILLVLGFTFKFRGVA
ncbi:hypothetical protein CL629_01785 [bacterium]|nr:hypothetical protein [bacterium]